VPPVKNEEKPYDWAGDRPKRLVGREQLLAKVSAVIQRGTSGYLVGCRGMGKSAFMDRLAKELPQDEVDVLVFSAPRSPKTVARAIQSVADEMERVSRKRGPSPAFIAKLREHANAQRLPELFEVYLDETPADIERLVLLYDELDAYADPPELGVAFFNDLEDVRKHSEGRIVVFAAGGLGLVALDRLLLGSPFFSRTDPEVLEPLHAHDMERLADHFTERGTPLSPEVLETLRLATGGNPGLATFGLQHLWELDAPSPRDVTKIFDDFRDKHTTGFLDRIRDPIFASEISDAPELVWRDLQRMGGKMTSTKLNELVKQQRGRQTVKPPRIFEMLRSTGLIRATADAYRRASIDVEIIPSILTFDVPEAPDMKGSIREQLVADLCDVLASIHRMAPDFFRSRENGDKKSEKRMVPESVFSAVLVIGLEPRGWKVEREAQSAASRTDIKAQHDRFGEQWGVVEVKLWHGTGYQEIHAQVTGYFSQGVAALACVMVADHQDPDWPVDHVKKCLDGKVSRHERKEHSPSLSGHLVAHSSDCPIAEVDHFLLQLPKRR
jgi:AAA domain